MRHLLSLVLGLVLAPLIYVAAGFSAVKFADVNSQGDIALVSGLLGLAAALVAGGLYALLVMARLSPFGPVVAGLLYLGVTVWDLLDRTGYAKAVPAKLFGIDHLLTVPVGFGSALLAVPLLFTVFSPRRWRRSAQPAVVGYQAAPAYPTTPGSPAYGTGTDTTMPGYAPPTSPASTYEAPSYQSTGTGYQSPVYNPPAQSVYPAPTSAAPLYNPFPSQPGEYTPPSYTSPNDPTVGGEYRHPDSP
jgi:hypothetical protein